MLNLNILYFSHFTLPATWYIFKVRNKNKTSMLINMESVFNEKERNRTTSRGLCLYCSLSMRNFQCRIQKKYSCVFIYNFERGIYLLDLITTVAFQKSFAILWKKKTWVHSEVAHTQLTFTCSKSTTRTLEKGVKFVQS